MKFFNVNDIEAIDFSRVARMVPGFLSWNPLATQAKYIRAFLESEDVLKEHEINTAARLAAFLAQGLIETGFLKATVEGMSYSAERLMKVWPSRFPTLESAQPYARNAEKLANKVYSDRNGNGPPETGDGYRYRGRGFFQITGKGNYQKFGELAGVDLVSNPEALERDFKLSIRVAAAYFQKSGLAAYADRGDFAAVSRGVNLGNPRSRAFAHGEADRIKWTQTALALFQNPESVVRAQPAPPSAPPSSPDTQPPQPQPEPAPPSAPAPSEDALRVGDSGVRVRALQRQLRALGYALSDGDGVYGATTARAIRAFQHEHGLGETGDADAATRVALENAAENVRLPPGPSRTPQPGPDKPLSHSRTLWGAILAAIAGIIEFLRAGFSSVAKLFPIVETPYGPFNTVWILAAVLAIGLCVVIYARIDDRAKGRS
jgi:predicted chitinase